MCPTEKSKSYRSKMTWGWVNNEKNVHFWINYPFNDDLMTVDGLIKNLQLVSFLYLSTLPPTGPSPDEHSDLLQVWAAHSGLLPGASTPAAQHELRRSPAKPGGAGGAPPPREEHHPDCGPSGSAHHQHGHRGTLLPTEPESDHGGAQHPLPHHRTLH